MTYLDGRRFQSEQFVTGAFCVAVHVDEDMYTVRLDTVGSFTITRDLKRW